MEKIKNERKTNRVSKDNRDNRKKNKKIWISIVIASISSGLFLSVISLIYMENKQPIIKRLEEGNNGGITFGVDDEYRSLKLRVYPQLIIKYGNSVYLQIHLQGYYENEFLIFGEDLQCTAVKENQKCVYDLQNYLFEEIVNELNTMWKIDEQEAEKELQLYVSNIGFVKYVNKRGNDVKRYCIIEDDGLVIDYDIDDEEIINRLFEMNMNVECAFSELKQSEILKEIITMIGEEIAMHNG